MIEFIHWHAGTGRTSQGDECRRPIYIYIVKCTGIQLEIQSHEHMEASIESRLLSFYNTSLFIDVQLNFVSPLECYTLHVITISRGESGNWQTNLNQLEDDISLILPILSLLISRLYLFYLTTPSICGMAKQQLNTSFELTKGTPDSNQICLGRKHLFD